MQSDLMYRNFGRDGGRGEAQKEQCLHPGGINTMCSPRFKNTSTLTSTTGTPIGTSSSVNYHRQLAAAMGKHSGAVFYPLQPQLTRRYPNEGYISAFGALNANIGVLGNQCTNSHFNLNVNFNNQRLNQQHQRHFFQQQQQQQQQHQLLQRHIQQQPMQQQQYTMPAIPQKQQELDALTVHQQQDEISKSLKVFAQCSVNMAQNDSWFTQTSYDTIMHDFASNGYIRDDWNQCNQQYQTGSQTFCQNNLSNNETGNNNNMIHESIFNNKAQQLAEPTLNLNDVRHNLWNAQQPYGANTGAAACAATASNIDFHTNKKSHRTRHNSSGKQDKYVTKHCVFCENNNEPEAVVKSHSVRDSFGRVLCPKLRTYICPICGASGDMAHTIKYCPKKPIITMEDAIRAQSFRLTKSPYYKQQMKV